MTCWPPGICWSARCGTRRYGLNVHEALCRGLAVMVTRTRASPSGSTTAMRDALLPDGIAPAQLADRLRAWRTDVQGWRTRAAATGGRLRARSWADMAAELVAVAQGTPRESVRMTRTHRFLSGFMTGYAHLVLATIAGLWLTPFFLRHLGQSTYGLWLVGTQIIAYLLLMDLGIVALLPRETAYITGRTGRHDAPELRQLIEKTLTLACVQTPVVLVAALIALWWLPASWAALRVPLAVALGLFVLTFPLRVFQAALTGLQDLAFVARTQLVAWLAGTAVNVVLVLQGFTLSALAAGWCVTQATIIAACAVRLATIFPGAMPRRLARARAVHRAGLRRAFRLGLGEPDCAGAAERNRRDDHRRAARPRRGRALCLHRQAGVGPGESAPGDPAKCRTRAQRAPEQRRSRPAVPGQRGARAGDARGQRPGRLHRAGRQRRIRAVVGRARINSAAFRSPCCSSRR